MFDFVERVPSSNVLQNPESHESSLSPGFINPNNNFRNLSAAPSATSRTNSVSRLSTSSIENEVIFKKFSKKFLLLCAKSILGKQLEHV